VNNQIRTVGVFIALWVAPLALSAYTSDSAQWRTEATSDGTMPTKRHEAGSVVVNGDLYVLGGRGQKPVEVYSPGTDGWQSLGQAPLELHHFHVFDTVNGNWSVAGQIPADRRRGGAGALVRNSKIYLIGGTTLGHRGGAVNWFDEYDPVTGEWTTLPNAPTARDHFQAVLIGDRIISTAGRQTSFPNTFGNMVAATDVYNFQTQQWSSVKPIPTRRAGAISVGVGSEVVVAGGEAAGQTSAYDLVEVYDVSTDSWRALRSMQEGRHSGAGSILGNRLHMVSGSGGIGGAPELNSHESVSLIGGNEPDVDIDNDGLSNSDEATVHNTDPNDPDTDKDDLTDGAEVKDFSTDPLSSDTDDDGLPDGREINEFETDPKLMDSDADGIDDGTEVIQGSNPNDANDPVDTDGNPDGMDNGSGNGDTGSSKSSGGFFGAFNGLTLACIAAFGLIRRRLVL